MTNYVAKFLEICPGLDLPAGEKVTSAMKVADLSLFPRLYLAPDPGSYVRSVQRTPGLGSEDKAMWMGFHISAEGHPTNLGYVDPAATLRGLGAPEPTALIRALVYRYGRPHEIYIFASQTPYFRHSEPGVQQDQE